MALKFDEALELLAENISIILSPEQELNVQDASEFTEQITKEFGNINSIFKGTISKLDQTYYFGEHSYPNAQVPWLWISMPFSITPEKDRQIHQDSKCRFKLKTAVHHPAVRNGYVSGEELFNLFFCDLNRVIDRMHNFKCKSGKKYTASINMGQKTIQIFAMKHGANGWEELPLIIYQFALSLNFFNDSVQYYYPDFVCLNSFYQINKSLAEEKERKRKNRVIKVEKLMRQVLKKYSITNSSIIRFHYFEPAPYLEPESNIGNDFLGSLENSIPLILIPGPLQHLFQKLYHFKHTDSVKMEELRTLFGMD
ncbi:uncharacterized protein LOC108093244 isoform X2 [Drosophila ficusphila]|uniref:uncharacterized protein LOC108093244 isoform X2 n=1 Tax=Drosophila ficusphila TaxID=30025 RepID=UPI001C894918|nr:uncharacterized protein LOC108093244 isoform X2 [Drosophila ficusphila]